MASLAYNGTVFQISSHLLLTKDSLNLLKTKFSAPQESTYCPLGWGQDGLQTIEVHTRGRVF